MNEIAKERSKQKRKSENIKREKKFRRGVNVIGSWHNNYVFETGLVKKRIKFVHKNYSQKKAHCEKEEESNEKKTTGKQQKVAVTAT